MSSTAEEEEETGDILGDLAPFRSETRPEKKLKKIASKNSYYFSSLPDLRVQNSDVNSSEDDKKSKSTTEMKKGRSKEDAASDVAGSDNRSFRKYKRKGKHLVQIEVLDGFVEKNLGGVGNTVDDLEDEDEYGHSSTRSAASSSASLDNPRGRSPRSASMSGISAGNSRDDGILRQKSSSDVLARAGKITSGITSTRSIYFCDVLYDGVLGQSVYGGDNINVAENLSHRKVHKSKASTSWKSVHTLNVRKIAADIGLRYAIVRVKKRILHSVLSHADAIIGSFRVPLGGLRQNQPVDSWYVITSPPAIGKVRLRITYKSTLAPHHSSDKSKKPRLLVKKAPHLLKHLPAEKISHLYFKPSDEDSDDDTNTNNVSDPSIPFNDKTLSYWPPPRNEVVEEIYDDVSLMSGENSRSGAVGNILVSGALILSSYRLIFMPHRAAFRKGSRQEVGDVTNNKQGKKLGFKYVDHLEIPLGWVVEMSLLDAIELGHDVPAGTVLEIKCKLPGVFYFHLGSKKMEGVANRSGCCFALSNRSLEEVSLEQLTYSPEILVETLVSKMEWLVNEQQARLFKNELIVEVKDISGEDTIGQTISNPLVTKLKNISSKNLIDEEALGVQIVEDYDDEEEDNNNKQANKGPEDTLNRETESKTKIQLFLQADDAERLGFRQNGWREYEQPDFHLCKSYPYKFFVPASITDEEVKQVSKYRSRGRIPALVWRHPYTGAVLCRCAQPMSGLISKSSSLDKKMLIAISEYSHSEARRRNSYGRKRQKRRIVEVMASFHENDDSITSTDVVSAGEKAVADVNDSATEDTSNVTADESNANHNETEGRGDIEDIWSENNGNATEIDKETDGDSQKPSLAMHPTSVLTPENDSSETLNIMDMRPLLNVVANKLGGKGTENLNNYSSNFSLSLQNVANIHVMRKSLRKLITFGYEGNWEAGIRESKWLDHTTMLLVAAMHGIEKLQKGISVLVHCSDGWDRTPQATSLIMLMSDPFYRTIRGFICLVQTQWCDFGHKFLTRLHSNSGQVGPIFIQFMDCVYQVMKQFPKRFEFTEELLVFLIDHAYSGWFFTFLGDTMKFRFPAMSAKDGKCAFQVALEVQQYFVNNDYVKEDGRVDVLKIKTSPQDIKLWMRLYGRSLRSVRNFRHTIKKPKHVTRILHRKIMIKMLPSVLNGIRPPSRAKRTSLFMGGHLTISRSGNRARARMSITRNRNKTGKVSLSKKKNSVRRSTRSTRKKFETAVSTDEQQFTNQGSGRTSSSCAIM